MDTYGRGVYSHSMTTAKTLGFVVMKNGAAQKTHAYADLTQARNKANEQADTLLKTAKRFREVTTIEIHRWNEGDGPYHTSGLIAAFKVDSNGRALEWNGEFYQ